LEDCGEGFVGGDSFLAVLEIDSIVRDLFQVEMARLALGFVMCGGER